MQRLIILLIVTMISSCSNQTPQSELNDTITVIISLIDKGDEQELLTNYAYFSDSKRVIDIPEDKLVKLKSMLIRAKGLSPKLSENDTFAVYESKVFKKPLKFIKIDNRWLLMN